MEAPHGQEVGGEEAGPDSEEEEEPDEYAGLPLWRRALLRKRAEEERKEEEKERKVGGAEVTSCAGEERGSEVCVWLLSAAGALLKICTEGVALSQHVVVRCTSAL